uniref:Uncharacterized protein n=1 Tax=Arundo donax TaxID=35708 RepID=A0A0A8ZTP3_ARUDO
MECWQFLWEVYICRKLLHIFLE